MDDQNRTPDTPAEEQVEITFDGQDTGTTVKDALDAAAPMLEKIQEHIARVTETIAALAPTFKAIQERTDESIASLQTYFNSDKWQEMRQKLEEVLKLADETEELSPYLEEELKKPEYEGKTIDELLHVAERDEDSTPIEESLYVRALAAARAARDAAAVIAAQQAGRDQRRTIKENAKSKGAIMGLETGLIIFSDKVLWNVFTPDRISRIGTLPVDEIDETGRVTKTILDKNDIIPVTSLDYSTKALFLLTTIRGNSVENFYDRFVEDGSITFYVKGVLDKLGIDPRIKDDGQLDINRKTAGAIYLEKQFEPLLTLIGTMPDGSRYSVFNYDGYDANTDTMTIRTPYIYKLWERTQTIYAERKAARKNRIEEGKKPLKDDLKPLEVNTLFKPTAYKEDDTVLEIAVYITNVLLAAGKGTRKKTEIEFKTLIKNCSRLSEEMKDIDKLKNGSLSKNGKKINKTAYYNSELRKIERAYSLIMNPDKCDALNHFDFTSFVTVDKNGIVGKFKAPTKNKLDGKIQIVWNRIDTEE